MSKLLLTQSIETTCRFWLFKNKTFVEKHQKIYEKGKIESFGRFRSIRTISEMNATNFQVATTSGSLSLRKNDCPDTFSSPRYLIISFEMEASGPQQLPWALFYYSEACASLQGRLRLFPNTFLTEPGLHPELPRSSGAMVEVRWEFKIRCGKSRDKEHLIRSDCTRKVLGNVQRRPGRLAHAL